MWTKALSLPPNLQASFFPSRSSGLDLSPWILLEIFHLNTIDFVGCTHHNTLTEQLYSVEESESDLYLLFNDFGLLVPSPIQNYF